MAIPTFKTHRRWFRPAALLGIALLLAILAINQLPAIGAGGLLHPMRRREIAPRPPTCEDVIFNGAGARLKGWRCAATTPRRGTLVYLHGIADNRSSAVGVIDRFGRRGFDVIAYDSRAHGESEGDSCTYGFFEKEDLRAVLDTVDARPIILLGTSLGGAVALQLAATDSRVAAVIAAETFSDLRTVAIERAPFIFTRGIVEQTFQLAERRGQFRADAVSPVRAASEINVPVLLIHGERDTDTSPDHSRRVFAALNGPKRLLIVPEAGHNTSIRSEVWREIENWLDQVLANQSR